MIAVITGFVLFMAVSIAALIIGMLAQKHARLSLHQSLHGHSAYVRFMQDKHDLNRIGYAQQLARRFGGFSAFAVPFSSLSPVAGGMLLLLPALANGGPWMIGFAWPLMGLFSLMTACAYATQFSASPTSGGIYHYTTSLVGRRYGIIAGWLHIAGSIILLAFTNIWLARWLTDIANWVFAVNMGRWLFFVVLIALFAGQWLFHLRGLRQHAGYFTSSVWIQVGGVVAIIALLSVMNWGGELPPEALFRWTHPFSLAGSPGWTDIVIGLLLLTRMYTGSEQAGSLAEETDDPRISIPWAVYLSSVYVFIFGYIFFALLYLHYPLAPSGFTDWRVLVEELTATAVRYSSWVKPALLVLFVWAGWGCGLSAMSAASRTWFAMCRDDVMLMSKWGSQVSTKWRVPHQALNAAVLLSLLIALLACLRAPSDSGIQSGAIQLLAIALIGTHMSGIVSIGARCYARLRRQTTIQGPWQLGKLEPVVDVGALVWLVTVITGAAWVLSLHAWLFLIVAMTMLVIAAEGKHRRLRRKEFVKTTRTSRFSRHQLDEFIRVERQFPPL